MVLHKQGEIPKKIITFRFLESRSAFGARETIPAEPFTLWNLNFGKVPPGAARREYLNMTSEASEFEKCKERVLDHSGRTLSSVGPLFAFNPFNWRRRKISGASFSSSAGFVWELRIERQIRPRLL